MYIMSSKDSKDSKNSKDKQSNDQSNKKSNINNDYIKERNYTTHHTYTKDGENEPKFYNKRYRHRRDANESSSNESSDEEACEMKPNFFNNRPPAMPWVRPPFCPMDMFYGFPAPPQYYPNFCYNNNDNDSTSDDDGDCKSDDKSKIPYNPMAGFPMPRYHMPWQPLYQNRPNMPGFYPNTNYPQNVNENVNTDANIDANTDANTDTNTDANIDIKKQLKQKKKKILNKIGKKYAKNPMHHLNKALYYYHNQNPNFDPYFQSNAYGNRTYPYNYSNNHYDPCPLFYYDVHDKLSGKNNKKHRISDDHLNNTKKNNNQHTHPSMNGVPDPAYVGKSFVQPKNKNLDTEPTKKN
jgi:hypothetical protein